MKYFISFTIGLLFLAGLLAASAFWLAQTPPNFSRVELKFAGCHIKYLKPVSANRYLAGGQCIQSVAGKKKSSPPRKHIGFLMRVSEDLTIDTSFGHSGRVFFTAPNHSLSVTALTLDKEEHIIVAGNISRLDQAESQEIFVTRLSRDGGFDDNFELKTFRHPHYKANIVSDALFDEQSGALLLAGWGFKDWGRNRRLHITFNQETGFEITFSGHPTQAEIGRTLSFARNPFPVPGSFLTVGEFGGKTQLQAFSPMEKLFDGKAQMSLDAGAANYGSRVEVFDDGIFIAGTSNFVPDDSPLGIAYIAKIQKDGSPDSYFGEKGLVHLDVPQTSFSHVTGIFRDKEGELYVVGKSLHETEHRIFINKLTKYGNNRTDFGQNGYLIYPGKTSLQAAAFNPETSNLMIGSDNNGKVVFSRINQTGKEFRATKALIPTEFKIYGRVPNNIYTYSSN